MAIAGLILVYAIPKNYSFIILSIILIVTAFIDKTRFFLVVWFFGGLLPLLTSPAFTGVYIRHSAFALSIILGITCWEAISEYSSLLQNKIKKTVNFLSAEKIVFSLTVVIVLIVFISKHSILHVPFVSKQIERINHVKNLGNNFKDVVIFLCERLDEHEQVYFLRSHIPFFHGPKSEQNILYSQKHLERLQPAGILHFASYFEMYNRKDLTVKSIEQLFSQSSQAENNQKILVATNNWEADYLESNLQLKTWKVFKRGNDIAKIYKMDYNAEGRIYRQ
jgi:hypothetical protein